MKARKRFSRVVASTLTLALLLGMLPMAAFAADPDYAPTVAELKNMTMENVLNAEEISLYSNGEMTNYFYRGINLSNNALVKVGYTLEQSQPASLALYKMAEGDEWTGDEVELVPGDTTDPEPFLADFVGYLYGTRVLDNIDTPPTSAPLILPMILKTAATPVPGAMAIIYPSCMTSLAASLNPPMRMVRKNSATTS